MNGTRGQKTVGNHETKGEDATHSSVTSVRTVQSQDDVHDALVLTASLA